MKGKVEVKNVPDYARSYPFWVCRKDEKGTYWFYGAWNDTETADHIAKIVDGVVVAND